MSISCPHLMHDRKWFGESVPIQRRFEVHHQMGEQIYYEQVRHLGWGGELSCPN